MVGVMRYPTCCSIASTTAQTNSAISGSAGATAIVGADQPIVQHGRGGAPCVRLAELGECRADVVRIRLSLNAQIDLDQPTQRRAEAEHQARIVVLQCRRETAATMHQIAQTTPRLVWKFGSFQTLAPAGALFERRSQVSILVCRFALARSGIGLGPASSHIRQDMLGDRARRSS
jgi:hypothetical protein